MNSKPRVNSATERMNHGKRRIVAVDESAAEGPGRQADHGEDAAAPDSAHEPYAPFAHGCRYAASLPSGCHVVFFPFEGETLWREGWVAAFLTFLPVLNHNVRTASASKRRSLRVAAPTIFASSMKSPLSIPRSWQLCSHTLSFTPFFTA